MSKRLSVVQESVQGHVSATSTKATDSITDAIETEGFTRAVEMGLHQSQTVNALSQQVQQAQLQIHELKLMQMQSNSSKAEATRALISLPQDRIRGVASAQREDRLIMKSTENAAQHETRQMQFVQKPGGVEQNSQQGEDLQLQKLVEMSAMVDEQGFGTALLIKVGLDFACPSYVANHDIRAQKIRPGQVTYEI